MGGRGCAGREKESALSCRRERKTHRRPVFWPPPCCCGDAAATTTWPAQVLEGLLAWMLGMQDSDMAILVMFFYTRRTLSDFFFRCARALCSYAHSTISPQHSCASSHTGDPRPPTAALPHTTPHQASQVPTLPSCARTAPSRPRGARRSHSFSSQLVLQMLATPRRSPARRPRPTPSSRGKKPHKKLFRYAWSCMGAP